MKLKFILLSASALLMATTGRSQTHTTTGGQKYTLVEEGTGTWCGYCPDGAQDLQEKIEPTYPRVISVAFHNGDPMTLSPDDFNSTFIGGTGNPGWPGGCIDRAPGVGTSIGQNRGYWLSDVAARNSLTPKFDVTMTSTYDTGTRLLTVKVTGKALTALTGNWNINAYVIEDSLPSTGSYAQDNYAGPPMSYYSTSVTGSPSWFIGYGDPIVPASRYSHMNVVEKVLATGGSIWGDAAFTNPAVNTSVTKTYTYTIPPTSNYKLVKVVGLVQKFGTTTSDRAIENSILAKVKTMWKNTTGVEEAAAAMEDVELYPNPARNTITVRGSLSQPTATNITIVNSIGQVVYNQQYPSGGTLFAEVIPVTGLGNGLYFMNITNDGKTASKKFIIQR